MVEQNGLMKANHVFFLPFLLRSLLLDVAAWDTLWAWGTSFLPFFLCAVLLRRSSGPGQGCLQHDVSLQRLYGEPPATSFCDWSPERGLCQLNHMNSWHLAKPHCSRKDPDTNMHPFSFALRKVLSMELGKQKIKVHAIQPPTQICLPDLTPCPAASLPPLVYFLFLIWQKK